MPEFLDLSTAISALEEVPLGVMIVQEREIKWINDSCARILSASREDLLGLDALQAAARGLDALFEDSPELCLTRGDGETRWLRREHKRLEGSTAEAYFFQDVSPVIELERQRDRLQATVNALETRDGTTGLLKRNAILHALDSELTRSRRYYNPLSVIQLSLVPPERVGAGEVSHTLLTVAQEFKDHLRWADQIGHLEPARFLLILPETPLADAERLAAKLARERVALAHETEGWRFSYAVTCWRKGDDVRKLLERLASPSPMQAD